jgi:hypothetical protein
VDKVVAHGHHCACPCCPCLKTWETTVGWPGRPHGGWAGALREDWLIDQNHFGTQTKAFSFASPFKNHWDAMQGKPWVDKVAARGPHCAWLCYPCLKTWETTVGWPRRVHGGPVAGVEVRARWGLCVGKAKIILKLTATHPPPPRLHPLARSLGHAARHAAYNDHLDTRQDGSAGKAGALTACRGEARVQ